MIYKVGIIFTLEDNIIFILYDNIILSYFMNVEHRLMFRFNRHSITLQYGLMSLCVVTNPFFFLQVSS